MNHIAAIQAQLDLFGLDAMLLTSPPGERYAVGFSGEGYALITRTGGLYTTDGRYIEAAQAQVTGLEIQQTSRERSHTALAADYLRTHALERVGFEEGAVSVRQFRAWEEALPCTLIPAQALPDGLRASKDAGELERMEQAQAITDQTFTALLDYLRPGLTEQQVAARIVYELLSRGGERVSFDPIVASGPNGSMPHAIPGERVLQKGDFITLDFGCMFGGYCSDMTRTVALGQPTQEMAQVYRLVLDAQQAALEAARAGIPGQQLDGAARQVIEAGGYGPYFSHSLGHSLGLEIHESPNAAQSNPFPLPAGAVLSVEPGIYLPGRFGVRIEDVVILHEGGCKNLTRSPKELISL